MNWKGMISCILALILCTQLLLVIMSHNVSAPGYITIGIQAEPPVVNINQSNEPVTIGCSISFEGASALPYTVHMEGKCDVGEVYLSQNVFVFHYPETVYFDAIVYIDPETENDTEGMFTLSGYYVEGGIQYPINPVCQMIHVLNYDTDYEEGKELEMAVPSQPSNDVLFYYGFPSLLFFLGFYLSFVRPRLSRNVKSRRQTNN